MSLREVLTRRNRELVTDVSVLQDALARAVVPGELQPFRERVVRLCARLRGQVERNQADLALGRDEILVDILSNTQVVSRRFGVANALFASPILRALERDRLPLILVGWLHRCHPTTASLPPAVTDGHCAVRPFLDPAPIYYLPAVEKWGLPYLPLLFHEFGHVLYAVHKPEMDDLVGELQRQIPGLLLPLAGRNDPRAQQQATQRQVIAYTWYAWAQEFFCDAVGLVIGGPAYLHAFSNFLLGGLNRGDFSREPRDLAASLHPVSRLRIQFLVERARSSGFDVDADIVQRLWEGLARELGLAEEYHGYYDATLAGPLRQTIEDMLIESAPRPCQPAEAGADAWDAERDSLVQLVNRAWRVRLNAEDDFDAWQAQQIERVIGRTDTN